MTTSKRLWLGLVIAAAWLVAGVFLMNMTPRYPWKKGIEAKVSWIGQHSRPGMSVAAAWDANLVGSFGGVDDPDVAKRTADFRPAAFTPKLNPFYVSLPFNDLESHGKTKPETREVVPWFDPHTHINGESICRNRWVAIRQGDQVCYAQWTEVGPYEANDWYYVFGNGPQPTSGHPEGIGISPAVRDCLGYAPLSTVDWRFVEEELVPEGPWRKFGNNNPFAQAP